MALQLSVEANAYIEQQNIAPNIVLEIDGFSSLYGLVKITRVARYGDNITYGQAGLKYGGTVEDDTSKDYISFSGTTNNISQKLNQDKGGTSSVTSFKIRLLDKNNELTLAFSPGVTVLDILGREATVYWQAQGSNFTTDSVRLFVGIIASASFGAGYVDLVIQHPEALKRQVLLPKVTTELAAALNNSATSCLADSTVGFVSPQENLETYIRINDEIIKVGAIDSAGFQSMTRAQFGTVAASHGTGDEVESFYRLQGDPIELALRLLLSNPDSQSFATETATSFVNVTPSLSVSGGIFFPGIDVQKKYGLVVGDQVSISGSGLDPSNLIGYTNILSFVTLDNGSYIIVDASLVAEVDVAATASFKSKYNKLSFGAGQNGIKPYHVDVEQFESLSETFSAQFFDYDFYIKDDLKLDEFMATQLFYPSGLFSLPRQGRISVGISAPPILGPNAKTIDSSNVLDATRLTMTRSINQAFYNAIAYKFNDDAIEDKFLSASITQSSDSTNRINIGNRVLQIECGGIRESEANRNKIEAISSRFLDRYQYGAETFSVELNFKTGFAIEPGDTVIFDGSSLGVSDITQGSREFIPRVFEVTDRAINLKTGRVQITAQDTNLSTRARYGVWAPSSLVGTGSTGTNIVIKRSFETTELELERDKWSDYLFEDIVVRTSDHSTIYSTTLVGFSASNPNVLIVSPSITIPTEDMIVEPAPYSGDAKDNSIFKATTCYFSPQVAVTSGNTSSFDVDSGDVAKFYVGAPVRIHLSDYSEDDTSVVTDISGTTITIAKTLSFTISSSHLIDNIGFSNDSGSPFLFY